MRQQNNLTALRWIAAGLVLFGHSFLFLGLPAPAFMQWVPMGPLGVYIFFSISGYLVTQSWVNDPHPFRFLKRRALRILPGLTVCTFLSILVLGPLLTTLPLNLYFTNVHTKAYFSNIALYISYYLPGVFETNHYPNAVNGSLWSLPVEFLMYLSVLFFGWLKIPKKGWLMVTIGLLLLSKLWAMSAPDMLVIYRTDLRQVIICGVYFWVGAIFYQYRINRFFSISSVLGAAMIWVSLSRWPELFVMASWVILPFLVLAFGLACGPWISRLTKYDYSYGIYIYAFPVQQTVAKFWPDMALFPYVALTSSITIAVAALSWHWVEYPALRWKPARPRADRLATVPITSNTAKT